jgi:hypothetical protein
MYHQGKCTLNEYIDEFHDLIDLAGYTEGMAIVMKFIKGLQTDIQDQIAQLPYGRPDNDEPEEWYKAVVNCTENRHTNVIFHGPLHTTTSSFSCITFTPMAPKPVTSYGPTVRATLHPREVEDPREPLWASQLSSSHSRARQRGS